MDRLSIRAVFGAGPDGGDIADVGLLDVALHHSRVDELGLVREVLAVVGLGFDAPQELVRIIFLRPRSQ